MFNLVQSDSSSDGACSVWSFSQLDITLELLRSDFSTSGCRCKLTCVIIPFNLLHSILWMTNRRFLCRLQDFNTPSPCPALLGAASTCALLRDAPIMLFSWLLSRGSRISGTQECSICEYYICHGRKIRFRKQVQKKWLEQYTVVICPIPSHILYAQIVMAIVCG